MSEACFDTELDGGKLQLWRGQPFLGLSVGVVWPERSMTKAVATLAMKNKILWPSENDVMSLFFYSEGTFVSESSDVGGRFRRRNRWGKAEASLF